jgi:hypothetical protein
MLRLYVQRLFSFIRYFCSVSVLGYVQCSFEKFGMLQNGHAERCPVWVSGPVQYSVMQVLHCDGRHAGTTRCFSCEGVREVGSWVQVDRNQRILDGTGCKMKRKVFDLRRVRG